MRELPRQHAQPLLISMHGSLARRPLELVLAAARLVIADTGRRRAVKFLLRTLLHWSPTIEWLEFIDSRPALAGSLPYVRRVLSDKTHRPFARRGLNVAARAKTLMAHYSLLRTLLPSATIGHMVNGARFNLSELPRAPGLNPYILTLGRELISQHQGELIILFIEPDHHKQLARLMMNIGTDEAGRRILFINGLQGPAPSDKDKIVSATRALDGLRPKRAVLEAAFAFARWMQADAVIAIAKKNHVSQTLAKWQNKVHADYDNFWQEFSSTISSDGDFGFSTSLPRHSLADLPAKKRKSREKRYQRLDHLATETQNMLTILGL